MPEPLVSILIPCHNAAAWIAETLNSALSQTWAAREIIVVDDGSTDGSAEIIRRFEGPEVKLIQQRNAGQSAAFNRALAAAQGEYLEFLDADDLLAPTKIEVQVRALQNDSPHRVAAGAWTRFTDRITDCHFRPEPVWQDMDPVTWLCTSWSGGGMMHGAAWLVPHKVVRLSGGWSDDLSLVNDFDFFSRVLLKSDGVKFCSDAKTYYRSGNGNSLSGRKSERAWKSAFDAFSRGTQNLLERENTPRTRKAAADTFQSFVLSAYPHVPELVHDAERRVAELGGSALTLRQGTLFNTVTAVFGWKTARRLQHRYQQLRRRAGGAK